MMWQFLRPDSADGYAPGWHNYLPDPQTGEDSVRQVEDLWQQHRCRALASPQAGPRPVRSGKYSYSLDFASGAGAEADTQGVQTNSETGVQRQVRRVSPSQACGCQKCRRPPSSSTAAPRTRRWSMRPSPYGALGARREADLPRDLPAMLAPAAGGLPACWEAHGSTPPVEVSGPEYDLVKSYFLERLSMPRAYVGKVLRVQNAEVYRACRPGDGLSIMFHGCRSAENEGSILQQGFLASKCRRSRPGFGTWFAYQSNYSDRGFAFDDKDGWRHLFVCAVWTSQTMHADATMRVVGQGGAYPQWIVYYRRG